MKLPGQRLADPVLGGRSARTAPDARDLPDRPLTCAMVRPACRRAAVKISPMLIRHLHCPIARRAGHGVMAGTKPFSADSPARALTRRRHPATIPIRQEPVRSPGLPVAPCPRLREHGNHGAPRRRRAASYLKAGRPRSPGASRAPGRAPVFRAGRSACRPCRLRPRGGRSPWRALYRCAGDVFVIAAIAPGGRGQVPAASPRRGSLPSRAMAFPVPDAMSVCA